MVFQAVIRLNYSSCYSPFPAKKNASSLMRAQSCISYANAPLMSHVVFIYVSLNSSRLKRIDITKSDNTFSKNCFRRQHHYSNNKKLVAQIKQAAFCTFYATTNRIFLLTVQFYKCSSHVKCRLQYYGVS